MNKAYKNTMTKAAPMAIWKVSVSLCFMLLSFAPGRSAHAARPGAVVLFAAVEVSGGVFLVRLHMRV